MLLSRTRYLLTKSDRARGRIQDKIDTTTDLATTGLETRNDVVSDHDQKQLPAPRVT